MNKLLLLLNKHAGACGFRLYLVTTQWKEKLTNTLTNDILQTHKYHFIMLSFSNTDLAMVCTFLNISIFFLFFSPFFYLNPISSTQKW